MKKLFTLVALAMVAFTANAKDITVYVFAENTPNLWYWGAADASADGYSWPGVALTETKEVKDKTFFYKTFADLAEDASLNIIVNYTGDEDKTEDINGVTSDIYLIYNGDKTYENVTEQYAGEEGGEEEAENLWAKANIEVENIWIGGPSWEQLYDLAGMEGNYELSEDGTSFKVSSPIDVDDNEWKFQVKLLSDINTVADGTKYSFSCKITPSYTGKYTIKLTDKADKDNIEYFYYGRQDMTAGETIEFAEEDFDAQDFENLKLIFDFGGAPKDGIINITDICLTATAPATAINTISVKANNNGAMYNLAGQRVGENYKGVVIMNGKKMIKK